LKKVIGRADEYDLVNGHDTARCYRGFYESVSPVNPGWQSQRFLALLQMPRLTPSGSQFFGQAGMLQAGPLKSSSHWHSPLALRQVPCPEHVKS
jgi:hypothetical protein